MHSVNW